MNILLVGEYSRLHNSLKEGLQKLGHRVVLLSTGDGFKDYPADIKLDRKYTRGLARKWRILLVRLFNYDPAAADLKKQFFRHYESLKGFDYVQLINESPLEVTPGIEQQAIDWLYQNNGPMYLLCCGTDYLSVQHIYNQRQRYSILTSYFDGKSSAQDHDGALKYLRQDFKELHEFVFKRIHGVIASSIDYDMPMSGHPQYLGMIPNPINVDLLPFQPPRAENPIVILHGINRSSYYKKGNDYFEAALEQVKASYGDRIMIDTVEDLPYQEYIEHVAKADIVLDQVYAFDQGYNALEAMARGKVVLTGAEREFMEHYQLKEQVAVNVLPDSEQIARVMSELIEAPEKLTQIGRNARDFIAEYHDYVQVAKQYLDNWKAAATTRE
ncbi:glycosyltransferase family protein [Aureitalea marina]|uniref:Glycosyl transferase family 1 n=1 Tax=Aureitalea marina TaxID=930804 RepID=A0A2S7KQF0_9FLAO|nr:glycosyltransferase [Aureitalea marina]PQB04845.1 glycosyl transferase family 1 [Aureitalea marina]